MGNLATIKGILVTAIQGLPEFSSKAADVHAHRAVQPENEQEQIASKLTGLSAFVSIERVQKGKDNRILKKPTAIVELWINTHSAADAADGAEDLLEGAIAALENLTTTTPEMACQYKTTFEDAYVVNDAPSPFLVYRLIITTNTIITNSSISI